MIKKIDLHVWEEYVKGLKPLKNKNPTVLHYAVPAPLLNDPLKEKLRVFSVSTEPIEPSEFSRRNSTTSLRLLSKKRLKRSVIEARLDLHGMTQAEAFTRLTHFIISCYQNEKHTLLVITGKGAIPPPSLGQSMRGILRHMLPVWLEQNELRQYVSYYASARARDGGEGAFYVKLRKKTRFLP